MHIFVSCLQVFMFVLRFENINQLSSERIEMLCALELKSVEITIHKSACVCVHVL